MSGQRVTVYQPQFSAPVLESPRVPRQEVSSGFEAVGEALIQRERQRDATDVLQARTQASGALTDLKFETLRQPWQVREQYFTGHAQGILSGLEENISTDHGKAMFGADWAGMYQNHLIDVKGSAYQGEKDQNTANLDQSLSDFAQQAAAAPSDEQANAVRQSAMGQIADAQGGGWITAEEGGKQMREFARRLDMNRARILIDRNPTTALQALTDQKAFQNLRAEDRISLQERADSKMQHQVAMADHAQIVSERNRKRAGDQLAKEGEDLIAQGRMTEEWMQTNKPYFDPSDYRILRHAMQEGGGTDSAQVVTDVYRGIYVDGTDQSAHILDAMKAHQILPATAKSMLDENKQTQGTPVSRGKAFITQYLKPSDLAPAPGAPQAFAEALAEFNNRVQTDPKADPMTIAREVVRRNTITNTQEMTLVMPLPQQFNGSRGDVTGVDHAAALQRINESDIATTKAFAAKHGGNMAAVATDPDYKREQLLIKQWREQLTRQIAADAASRAPGGSAK